MKLVKNKEGIFSLKGEYTYRSPIFKQVVVDGETYSKTTYEAVTCKLEGEEQDTWQGEKWYKTINIKPLDLEYKFIKYANFNIGIYKETCSYCLSENEHVALYQVLYYNNMLDKRILSLHCGKYDLCFDSMRYDINYNNTISLRVDAYGFNNYITINIKMKDFITIKNKEEKIIDHHRYVKFFDRYLNININKISDYDFTQALMKYKIKQKKQLAN